jgi:hypothetical protein
VRGFLIGGCFDRNGSDSGAAGLGGSGGSSAVFLRFVNGGAHVGVKAVGMASGAGFNGGMTCVEVASPADDGCCSSMEPF